MTEEDNALVERLAALIRSNVQVTVYPDEPCSYDYEVDAYDAAEAIAAEIERLSAALEDRNREIERLKDGLRLWRAKYTDATIEAALGKDASDE